MSVIMPSTSREPVQATSRNRVAARKMPVAGGRGLTACNSAVGVAAITDLMDGDGVIRLFEDRAVVADAQPEQPFELAAERLHLADAGGDVAMNGFFHSPRWWRTWSIVKPHSATTCSKGRPPSGFCRK